jgi:hypothetical protein
MLLLEGKFWWLCYCFSVHSNSLCDDQLGRLLICQGLVSDSVQLVPTDGLISKIRACPSGSFLVPCLLLSPHFLLQNHQLFFLSCIPCSLLLWLMCSEFLHWLLSGSLPGLDTLLSCQKFPQTVGVICYTA